MAARADRDSDRRQRRGGLAVLQGVSRSDREPITAYAIKAFDVSDREKLTAFASDVFVGRVVERAGTEPLILPALVAEEEDDLLPQTQFAVEVQETIKGEASGTVVVNQQGGVDRRTDHLILIDGEPLLEVRDVLLTTRYDPDNGWYELVGGGYGRVRLGGPAERDDVVQRFKRAAAAGPKGPVEPERLNPSLGPDTSDRATGADDAARRRCADAEQRGTVRSVDNCLRERPDR